MSIANRLESYLKAHSIEYDLIAHPHTETSTHTASAAHVPGNQLAKAVILKDGDDYLMMVLPSDYHVHLGALHRRLGRNIGLATERELAGLFPDCDEGAAPPIGGAYGIRSLVDKGLLEQPEVFFEAGDHEHLVRTSGPGFQVLQAGAEAVEAARLRIRGHGAADTGLWRL
jgi:Ala-tRNA(Pro) deacylase